MYNLNWIYNNTLYYVKRYAYKNGLKLKWKFSSRSQRKVIKTKQN